MRGPATDVSISTRLLIRVVVLLIAVWSVAGGVILVGFPGTSTASLGFDLADRAGQRLVGAHLLLLAPLYLLIALRPQTYGGLLWLPFAAQLAVLVTVGYSILGGDTNFGDGILAVLISALFVTLLSFVWITEQRTAAGMRMDEEDAADRSARGPAGEEDEDSA